MENNERTLAIYVPPEEFSLAKAGQRADEMVARSTFTRYRERKAPETLRRHRADLALFITYLHQIPGLHTVGDLYQDPGAWQGRRDRALMCLLLYYGLRCEEVQLLQVSSFDLATGHFFFEQPKVNGELRHQMHVQTYLALKRYLEEDCPTGPLLLGSRKNGQLQGTMSKSAIYQRVHWLGEHIRVERLSLHDCRHFWATSASEAGTDLENLKQAGGWASLEKFGATHNYY